MELIKNESLNQVQAYISNSDDDYNRFAIGICCELMHVNTFDNPEIPLKFFWDSINTFHKHCGNPLTALSILSTQMEELQMNPSQKFFICQWLCKCLKANRYNGNRMFWNAHLLLQSYCKKLHQALPDEDKMLLPNLREKLRQLALSSADRALGAVDLYDRDDSLKILTRFAPLLVEKETLKYKKPTPTTPL